MKKLKLTLAAIAAAIGIAAAMSGCKSIEVERAPQSLATVQAADGTAQVVRDAAGNPLVLDGGWSVDYFQHWNWQKFDALEAKAGEAGLKINNYASGADTNLTALVAASFEGGVKLVAAIGEAYVKIAGGGAQAATVMDVAERVYGYFVSKGGDPAKATVTAEGDALKVTDGETCVSCDKDGTCQECRI